ncbi:MULTISPECIES: hypothetical protein [unclassified Massilia]|uniref:hypothetical protein n=1 Tax=unclassified Massilia TaxID=2609279 RepID=UPI00178637CB|nr:MULTISPECIES: hypothetical protein [unclassified Massilia]MBD8528916.1 hypothetical protein [Massilia sp. CFBP 13647]MBD8673558.1 hypothetical protein [Massilia sp. CFBP 13721]
MYYLILTMALWRQEPAGGDVSSSMQTLEFRDELACRRAAAAWKADVLAARPKLENMGPQPLYSLSAVCVPSDSTSRIK